jgi:hypothetical protein
MKLKEIIVATNLGVQIPVYVTRKTADGSTGSYSLSLWMTLLAIFLVWLNIVLWCSYGIVQVAEKIF